MKMKIKSDFQSYEIAFEGVTQICGTGIPCKRYIIDSLCKHFSSTKYKEYEEKYVENIEIDGEIPGRKQWECIRISDVDGLISAIQINKSSLLGVCIKGTLSNFECQDDLMRIDEILFRVFEKLNSELINRKDVELQYTLEDLFEMVQKTSMRTSGGEDLHVLSSDSLIDVFLDIVCKLQEISPEKRLFVFENIDHYLSVSKYCEFLKRCKRISYESNSWFICTTSLNEYVCFDEGLDNGINVINDEVFIMPSLDRCLYFLKSSYPLERDWDISALKDMLKSIIHDIGRKESFPQLSDVVFLKLLNDSFGVRSRLKSEPKKPEIACLLDQKMI